MRNLATEIFSTINNLNPLFLKEIFKTKLNPRVLPNYIIVKTNNWWWYSGWTPLCCLLFCATSQNVFYFILIRFKNLKISLKDAAYFSTWSYFLSDLISRSYTDTSSYLHLTLNKCYVISVQDLCVKLQFFN